MKAVWFCLGQNLVAHRRQGVETLRRGHILANHSWDHPFFSQIGLEESLDQIRRTDALLQDIHNEAGVEWTPKLFRFPYVDEGRFRTEVGQFLELLGYRAGLWQGLDQPWWFAEGRDQQPWTHATFDSQDWGLGQSASSAEHRTKGQVVERLAQRLSEGLNEILVMHAWVPLETQTAMVECLAHSSRQFPLPR